MGLLWDDVDLERKTLRIRGELGKTQQERRGRVVPISEHLVEILAGWGCREGWLIETRRTGQSVRIARQREMSRSWVRSGVRKEAWEGQSHHSFRKGFVSGLRRLGADIDAIEYLVGHSAGIRGVYTDVEALSLREAVALIPNIGKAPVVVDLVGAKSAKK